MRAALVTGAARRIGAAIARGLAADGWQLVLHYASSSAAAETLRGELSASGASVKLLQGDLSEAGGLPKVMEAAFAAAPGLSLLVNNASLFEPGGLAEASAAALHRHFAVNAVAPLVLSQCFASRLPAAGEGCIVNILDNRVFAPNPDFFAYGVSKNALLGATRMMALALAPRIRVNAVAPGIVLPSGEQTADNFAVAHRLNPLQRGCTPEEVADAVRFIVSAPSMTGAVVTLDGGQSLANPGRDVQFIAGSSS